jgi:hypothetical protein
MPQHAHDGQAVSAGQIATVCPAPWHRRADLVTQALVLLERHGLVLVAADSTRVWKITAAGRLMLAPRRGPGARAASHRRRPARTVAAVRLAAGQPLSRFRPAAAENFAARLAAIWIVSPVAGLRPSRAARSLTANFAQAGEHDVAPRGELAGDRVTQGVDDAPSLAAGDARVRGDLPGELVLGHALFLLLVI